jgi:hypothetical protein
VSRKTRPLKGRQARHPELSLQRGVRASAPHSGRERKRARGALLSAQARETAVAAAVPTAQKAGLPTRACGARALRRAARFADGWHALDASPKKIRDAAATLATFSPDRPVDISLRIRTAIGRATRPAPTSADPDRGALEGEPDVMTAAILSYRDAGVTHIVIDPDTNVLEQYLDDLERYAAEVRPLVTSPGAELCSALH